MFDVPETFIVATELEPGLGEPSPGGLLIVPEGNAGIERNVLRECAGRFQGRAEVNCLSYVGRDGHWHGLRRGDGKDYRNRNLGQPEQLGVFDVYGAGRAICSGLVEAIHEEEDIPTPNDFSGGIERRILHRWDGIRQ